MRDLSNQLGKEQLGVMRNHYYDFLVTGTNAVTEEGFLIQIDSLGNRVAGMAYGPHNVIVITGVNKIVKNINEGYKRLYYADL